MAVGEEHQGFGVAAVFRGMDAGLSADMAVAHLKAAGLPAIRMPGHGAGSWPGTSGMSVYAPIRVLVALEREEEAIEILEEEDA